jgi:glycosyltransferase involved in cell wall biosynthesis
MKVLHVLRKCDPAEWGGTETALHRLFSGLRERAVESVVYCPQLERPPAKDPLVESGFSVRRFRAFVPVFGLSEVRRKQLVAVGGNLMSFGLISALRREPKASVIHAHALGRLGGIALTIAKERQLPCVVTIHGGVLDLPEKVKQTFNAPESRGLEWGKIFGFLFRAHRLLHDADALVTCNAREAALLQQRDPSKRVVVQPHGVPIADFQKDHRAAARSAFPDIQDRSVVLSLGRIDPIKNQGWLLEQMPEILKKHPCALLVLAGACTDEPYGKRLEHRIHELGLHEHVLLTGGLPPNDPRLVGLLQEAAVLVLPSLSETFGLVILEGWAAGVPVIASRTSGASALIDSGANGWLFDLDNPQTFHRALDSTLSDPVRARHMAALGTEKVRAGYSVETAAERMKVLYDQLVEARLSRKAPLLSGEPAPVAGH